LKVNEPNNYGYTPLWHAGFGSNSGIIEWWIVSGREMDFGTPGNEKSDAFWEAEENGSSKMVTLLERFKYNPNHTRHAMRAERGWYDEAAAEMFALVVFASDGLLQTSDTVPSPAARFFNIARRLPLELQMIVCHLVVGSAKEIIPGNESEVAFKSLASRLVWSSIFTN